MHSARGSRLATPALLRGNCCMRGSRFALLFLSTSSRFFMTVESLAAFHASSSSSPRRRSSTTSTGIISKLKSSSTHYVFGYGSLICPESRSITNPALAGKESLPVLIQDVERVWSARTSSGYTAMGVRFQKGSECTGILIEVDPDELADLDRREGAYNRLPIQLEDIDQVPFLDAESFYDSDHPVFDGAERTKADPDVKVWVYVQKDAIPADPSHPIPQSYVDIIIRGCLTISKDFARSFIETTEGWNSNSCDEASGAGDAANVDNNSNDSQHWVDDRDFPIYKRADSEYSKKNADMIDQLLEEKAPQAYEERVDYDPMGHLEALADALDEDKAHPLAIQHVVNCVKEHAANNEILKKQ